MKNLVAKIALNLPAAELVNAAHSNLDGESETIFSDGCLIQYDKAILHGNRWDIYAGSSGVCFVIYKGNEAENNNFAFNMLESFRRDSLVELSNVDDIYYVVIFDSESHRALVRGNQYGLNRIYYYIKNDILLVSNRMENLIIEGAPGAYNFQSLYDYVYFNVVPTPSSVYREISIITPGEELVCNNKRITQRPYWSLTYTNEGKRSAGELKELFTNCIKSDIDRNGKTGAFLSGGLDSSTISGLLQQSSSSQVPTFSIGFDEEGYDETSYARAAAKFYGTEYHEYCVTPDDILGMIPIIVSSYSEPFGNSSAVPTYFCAKLAREAGVTRLLAGDGGDELFGGNERYRKQLMLDKFNSIPRPLKFLIQSSLGHEIIGRIPLLGKVSSYIRQANIEMPRRMERYNLIDRVGKENIFSGDFLGSININHPQEIISDAYNNIGDTELLNKMLGYDFKFTLVDNDLPKVVGMCDAVGIDVAFPYINEEMIAFAGSLPIAEKTTINELRVFFRRSMSNFLPRVVINKKKQGFGLPIGIWMMKNSTLRAFVFESVKRLEGTFLKENFCDMYFKDYMSKHAPYYGTLLWVLMILSEWIRKNSDLHKALR